MVSPKCKVILLYTADQGDDMTKTQWNISPWTRAPRISFIYIFSRYPVSRGPAMMIFDDFIYQYYRTVWSSQTSRNEAISRRPHV